MPARSSRKSDVEKKINSEHENLNPQILCDRKKCGEYGSKPRCYLEIFKDCSGYNGAARAQEQPWI